MSPPLGGIGGRQCDRQLRDDLSRGRAPPAAPATGPARRQLPPQAHEPQDLGEQQRPGLGDNPRSVSGHDDLLSWPKSSSMWLRMRRATPADLHTVPVT
jgi:hypothetical protein